MLLGLSYNEWGIILCFCNDDSLKNLLKHEKILRYSSQLLRDYKRIWETILDTREEHCLNKKELMKDTEIIDLCMDTEGIEDGMTYKDSPHYDNRVESIFLFEDNDMKTILLPKKVGKILMERPYEYYANKSIRETIHNIHLPWLQDVRKNYMLNFHSYDNIRLVYNIIVDDSRDLYAYTVDEILKFIVRKLHDMLPYLSTKKNIHMPDSMKKKIRNSANVIEIDMMKSYMIQHHG